VWIWANRFVVIDHDRGETHLVAVHEPDSDATEWLDRAEAVAGAWMGWIDPPAIALLDVEAYLEQDRPAYLNGIAACMAALEAGETYEVCLTTRVRLPPVPDPLDFYLWQRANNPAPYSAFLRYGDLAIASSSPERFLMVDADGWAECRPIKGTAPRSADPAQDQLVAKALAEDEKTRAENLMITDLLRNDLGVVCDIGTVHVPHLMAIESFETVHQLVSTIRGRLRDDVEPPDGIRACFPGGSMTGAPKKRTMEIIDDLEGEARGVYSGAIGYLGLSGGCDLNIVIRTIVMDGETTTIGTGGAIVMQSDHEAEYQEIMLKARALINALAAYAAPDGEIRVHEGESRLTAAGER
jgi:para-aminobenzoate synthetase